MSEECIIKQTKEPEKKNTVIMIDFDDTICLSSEYKNKMEQMTEDIGFVDFLTQLNKFFNKALSIGKTYIVTNAELAWVEMIKAYIPIPEQITIRSAKDESGEQDTGSFEQYVRWKTQAFTSIIDNERAQNVISYGDSHVERQALLNIMQSRDILGKSFKLIEKPKMEQLKRQLMLLTDTMEYFANHDQNTDNMLVVSLFG